MPAGKYSFYLHPDDRTDMLAAATLETVSQPLRGEFLRTAAAAGSVLYLADNRLPGLVTELFDGRLRYGQLASLLAALSGQYDIPAEPEATGLAAVTGTVSGAGDKTERRRFTLQLPDTPEARRVAGVLDASSSRQRGTLLRSLIIAGFALHTLDARLPRLLASLPVPPDSVAALGVLAGEIAGVTVSGCAGRAADDRNTQEPPAPADKQAVIRKNMKNIF